MVHLVPFHRYIIKPLEADLVMVDGIAYEGFCEENLDPEAVEP